MLTVVNYNNANLESLKHALSDLRVEYKFSDNEFEICKAEKLILPGYAAASLGIKKIHILNLFTILRILKKPLLGIGLGMEILCDYSPEGNVSCLGILGEKVKKFDESENEVPYHGMHSIELKKESLLLNGVEEGTNFYFDNSYYLPLNQYSTAVSRNRGTEFSAAVEKGNFYGVQFHPEDSGENGLKVLNNFIALSSNGVEPHRNIE